MNELAPVESQELPMLRAPQEVLQEGMQAAKVLQDVISKKRNPVKFGGEQYLEFEDWQTVATFYQCTTKVISVKPIELGDCRGFEASAVVIHKPTGREISGATSFCMRDEENWSDKPTFQLASMAQTRACAKALRHNFSWVVVLAGYKPTPREEMTGTPDPPSKPVSTLKAEPRKQVEAEALAGMTDTQLDQLNAKLDAQRVASAAASLARLPVGRGDSTISDNEWEDWCIYMNEAGERKAITSAAKLALKIQRFQILTGEERQRFREKCKELAAIKGVALG